MLAFMFSNCGMMEGFSVVTAQEMLSAVLWDLTDLFIIK